MVHGRWYLTLCFTFIICVAMTAQKRFTLDDLCPDGKNYKAMSPKRLKLWWNGSELMNSDTLRKPVEYPKVFSRGYNIYVQAREDAEEIQVTTDGSRELVYGEAVHRNEFGIQTGIFMSPRKDRFAFYKMDQSMVADYPQVNTFEREATYKPDKYPMAGMTSHKVWVGVYDLKTGRTIYLDCGDPENRYFTNISWSPDGQKIYLIELNRDQNRAELDEYSATDGKKLRTLDVETDEKYVEPLHSVTFLPWDEGKFLMWSQRSGYWHLYIFDAERGQMIRQLTSGDFVVMEVLGFCNATKSVIIRSNEISPLQSNIFAVDVNTGIRTLLDNGVGVHSGLLSEDGVQLIDSYSTPEVPRAYNIINTVTGETKEYYRVPDPWEGCEVPQFRNGSIKAADGMTDIYYRMVLPPDFDAKEKYPTVVYVYGGPHAHNVEASWHWNSRGWETYMAQRGYVVFVLDNRGSENRGKAFEQVTFRQLGQQEMLDQIKGVEFLRTQPYVDADRLGVFGWSFGGFMTISLMTNYPDVFKVGAAGGPVIDWKWYEVMYGERYMDTPEANPDGYAKTSLLDKAKNLKGRLLVITGMNDPVVVPQNALQFIDACNQSGVYPDFYVYPGEKHNMKGAMQVHLYEKITRHFEEKLK